MDFSHKKHGFLAMWVTDKLSARTHISKAAIRKAHKKHAVTPATTPPHIDVTTHIK